MDYKIEETIAKEENIAGDSTFARGTMLPGEKESRSSSRAEREG